MDSYTWYFIYGIYLPNMMLCVLYRKIIYIAGELKMNATQDYVRLYIRISDLILLYDNNYLFSRE